MKYHGVAIPSDMFTRSFSQKINANDALIYGMIGQSAKWDYEKSIRVTKEECPLLANISKASVYRSFDRLLNTGLISQTGINSFRVNHHHSVSTPKS